MVAVCFIALLASGCGRSDFEPDGQVFQCIGDLAVKDLGSALGAPVANGSNIAESDDFRSSQCGTADTPDEINLWTAPEDGNYDFFLQQDGSSVVLDLRRISSDCAIEELDCMRRGGSAEINKAFFFKGEQALIIVDGSPPGIYSLHISRTPDPD